MRAILAALAAGLLFGLGLTVSRMIDPAKVLGFLDVFGAWDPSLAVVMATAVPVAALGYHLAARRQAPLCAPAFAAPAGGTVDRRLIAGAVLFGLGWGLAGYCPGPAITALGLGQPQAILLVAAMLAGMGIHRLAERRFARRSGLRAFRFSIPFKSEKL